MARHEKAKKWFETYLDEDCIDAEDRTEALKQVMDAYNEAAAKSGTPGEHESVNVVAEAAVENTIRADNFKRGNTQTMDPADAAVKARAERYRA